MPSAKKPWTRFIKRASVQGGEGGDRRRRSRQGYSPDLLKRLRRLELALVRLLAPERLTFDLDSFISSVLQLKTDAGGEDSGEAVPLPRKRSVDRQAERDHGVDRRPSGEELADDDPPWPEEEPDEEA